jgi:ABC-type sugar transport system substrate-binding protein
MCMRFRSPKVSLLALAAFCLLAAGAGPAQAAPEDSPRFISFDEPAPETDPAHNSSPEADLTYTYGWVAGDTLVV